MSNRKWLVGCGSGCGTSFTHVSTSGESNSTKYPVPGGVMKCCGVVLRSMICKKIDVLAYLHFKIQQFSLVLPGLHDRDLHVSGGSRISWGCQLSKGCQPIFVQNVCQKMHKNERISTGRGNRCAYLSPPLDPPLRVALATCGSLCNKKFLRYLDSQSSCHIHDQWFRVQRQTCSQFSSN